MRNQPMNISKHIPSKNSIIENAIFETDFSEIDLSILHASELPAEALGNHAKTQATFKKINDLDYPAAFKFLVSPDSAFNAVDPETGELAQFEKKSKDRFSRIDREKNRQERYKLQTHAAQLLPGSRTSKCLRLQTTTEGVRVVKSIEFCTASFQGLQTCGSVWACPCCAAKISEQRTHEVGCAIEKHLANGGDVCMVTYTFSHDKTDDLPEMLKNLSKAMAYMKGHRNFKDICKRINRIGSIRALEVTHGANGWHPHIHEIFFVRNYDKDILKREIFDVWHKAAIRNGLGEPSFERGVKVNDATYAAKYIAKEMTKSHSKHGREGSRTPFDLLRLSAEGDYSAGQYFKEYAAAFKGKRQLVWSRGLKQLFEIEEKTDDEIASMTEEKVTELLLISPADWKAVIKFERENKHISARATILSLAEIDQTKVFDYLQQINQIDYSRSNRVRSIVRPVLPDK